MNRNLATSVVGSENDYWMMISPLQVNKEGKTLKIILLAAAIAIVGTEGGA